MNHRTKRQLHGALGKLLGSPLNMSYRKKREILISLGGWLGQGLLIGERGMKGLVPQRATEYETYKPSVFETHAIRAKNTFPNPGWHWKVYPKIKLPKVRGVLGIPKNPDFDMVASEMGWNYIIKLDGKSLAVAIPVNYHLVVPKDIRVIGRRMIQRVWNHRDYSDRETWECSYWDFSKLSREEGTWSLASWSEGYIVKMPTSIAVEPTLSRAITMATSRTVRGAVRSILRDSDEAG